MAEVLFYHLTEKTLEQTLPGLLQRSLERGWRAVVQAGSRERVEALDSELWTFADESFVAHSCTCDGTEADQPVWLTEGEDNPNGAVIRFMVDGATPPDLTPYQRGVYIFDGHDNAALEHARARWKFEKTAGHDVTYWRQNPEGRWEKMA
ncbi:MAG: DNA polymerase III subunit chi [Nitratireductor sp.]|nr:DNA polymerase III subunit chi [Nitratireductor sp.]